MSTEVAPASEAEEALVGRVIAGKYRVDRLIGQGGMGSVFQATNLAIGKRVALKFLNRDATRDADATERFQREALAASVVESSHIVQIFDSGTSEDGLPFLVMELLGGEDLRARLNREGRLSVDVAVAVAVQVLRALVRAHAGGIVHRDLKPENVFLCERDDAALFVKIVDFGVSKLGRSAALDTLTGRGTVLGTAYYMSPEQAQAFSDVDGRTDLFSVGAILYECLAGRPPHVAPTYEAVLIAICTKQPDDIRTLAPDVPRSVADVIHRALATERSQRFASAQAMLDALGAALPNALLRSNDSASSTWAPGSFEPGSVDAATFSSTSRSYGTGRKHGMRTAVTAAIFVLAGFAVAAWWAGSQRENRTTLATSPGDTIGNAPGSASVALTASASSAAASLANAEPAPSALPALPAPSALLAPSAQPASSAALPRPSQRVALPAASARNSAPAKPGSRSAPPPNKPGHGVGQGLELSTREP